MKILHTADLHIGDPHYGRLDPARSVNTRLDDQQRCLTSIADKALDEGVDAAILAGDIYHSWSPSPAEENVFAEFVARLTTEGIHVFALTGNHERLPIPGRTSPLTHIETLGIERFHLLSEPGVTTIDVGGETLAIAAIPWLYRREIALSKGDRPVAPTVLSTSKLSSAQDWDTYISMLVEDLAGRIPKNAIAVLTAHLWTINVAGLNEKNIPFQPICRAQVLARKPFQYVALGHIHAHQEVWPDPPAIYPGSIERNDFSDANIPKGAIIVEAPGAKRRAQSASWRFFETPARRFVSIEMDLSGVSDPVQSVAAKARTHEIAGAVVRITATQKKGDPPFDARHLRPKLPDVFYLRVVREEVGIAAESSERSRAIEGYDSLGALAEYIDNSPELRPEKEKLLTLAQRLAEEVAGG